MVMTKSGRVFIVQKQMRFDRGKGELVPRFDLEPAKTFGPFEYLLSPTASPFKPESVIQELKQRLKSYGKNDWLLLIGNPCLIGFSVSIAAGYADGWVNLLQWHGKDQKYLPVRAKIY
jgi:hypothetical protein